MATIAAGNIYGIAPNADLHLVRTKGQIRTGGKENGYWRSPALNYLSTLHFIDHIIGHINARGESAKSVVNMSWGRSSSLFGHSYARSVTNAAKVSKPKISRM